MFWLSEAAGMRAGIRAARIIAAPTSAPIQAINRYWDTKRAGRFAPRRADIDPAGITEHMPNLMLIDVLRDGDYRYRLIGTAFTDGKGKDATDKRLTGVFAAQPEVVRLFKARFGAVVGDRSPLFSAGKGYWENKPRRAAPVRVRVLSAVGRRRDRQHDPDGAADLLAGPGLRSRLKGDAPICHTTRRSARLLRSPTIAAK